MPILPEQSMDLIFADPPFNNGLNYGSGVNDRRTDEEYYDFSVQWLSGCKRLLKPHGSIYVAVNTNYQAMLWTIMNQLFHWRDTICQHYTFGPAQQSKFTPSWIAIHYCTGHKKSFCWNADSVRVPSARQIRYKDRRALSSGKLPDNVWSLAGASDYESQFSTESNTWITSRVCGTFHERTKHPCQMNQHVLERIVAVSSNLGDVVFDPFLGSGTTAAACIKLKRKWLGIELCQDYVENIIKPRISETQALYERELHLPEDY
jgi:site-specific DNA-methyltransferase (adenine-specific)